MYVTYIGTACLYTVLIHFCILDYLRLAVRIILTATILQDLPVRLELLHCTHIHNNSVTCTGTSMTLRNVTSLELI